MRAHFDPPLPAKYVVGKPGEHYYCAECGKGLSDDSITDADAFRGTFNRDGHPAGWDLDGKPLCCAHVEEESCSLDDIVEGEKTDATV